MSTPAAPAADPWWSYAVGTATALRSGKEPHRGRARSLPELQRGRPPQQPCHLQPPGRRQRELRTRPSPFMVNLVLMAAAMAGQGVVNNRRRRDADRNSQPQWTNYREAAVLTTNQRLMCSRPQGGWTSFWYSEMAEFYPDPHRRAVTMSFADDHTRHYNWPDPPPRHRALDRPPVYGDRWHEDPAWPPHCPAKQPRTPPRTSRPPPSAPPQTRTASPRTTRLVGAPPTPTQPSPHLPKAGWSYEHPHHAATGPRLRGGPPRQIPT